MGLSSPCAEENRWGTGAGHPGNQPQWVRLFEAEGEDTRSEEVLRDLRRCGVQRVQTFEPLTSWDRGSHQENFSCAGCWLCVLHTVRDTLKRSWKGLEEQAEDLREISRAKTREEAEEALQKLGDSGAGFTPGLSSSGRARPVPSWRFCSSPPRTSWNGWWKRWRCSVGKVL
jgi:transposase-like protein